MLGFAFVGGLTSALMWERSNSDWQHHLDNAFKAGVALYGTVTTVRQNGQARLPQDQFEFKIVQPAQNERDGVQQLRFDVSPRLSFETSFALLTPTQNVDLSADRVDIRIFSADFRYSVSGLETQDRGLAFQFGALSGKLLRVQ